MVTNIVKDDMQNRHISHNNNNRSNTICDYIKYVCKKVDAIIFQLFMVGWDILCLFNKKKIENGDNFN